MPLIILSVPCCLRSSVDDITRGCVSLENVGAMTQEQLIYIVTPFLIHVRRG